MLWAYFGHHKCASRWITFVLRDVCELVGLRDTTVDNGQQFGSQSIQRWMQSEGVDLLAYINADWNIVQNMDDMRGIHVIRDPRDVCVSAYYSHRYSHELSPEWPQLRAIRSHLAGVSVAAGLTFEIEHLGWVFDAMRRWNYDHPRVLELRYEGILTDDYAFVQSMLRHLGFLQVGSRVGRPITDEQLARLVDHHRYERYADGRGRGQTDDFSHYRSGTAEQWRLAFGEHHLAQFHRLYPGLLEQLGYE